MDKRLNQHIMQSILRMPYCAGVNLTETDFYYHQKIYGQKSWAWWLNHLGTFVVFVIGFCGNILSLIVLCRPRLRRNSYTQYLIALAIVDTGAILCEVFTALDELHQYWSAERQTLIQYTLVTCKLYYYIRYIFYSMSSWIIVALAVERLVAIKFPLWSKYVCSVVNARRILALVLLFTMLIQSYHFFLKGLDCMPSSNSSSTSPNSTWTNANCRCKTLREYARIDLFLTIYIWRLILMTLLPSTIIITVNILIMAKLFNEHSLVDHRNASDNARRKTVLLYKISRMLVIVSSIYLILHVPGSSLEIIKYMFISVFKICNTRWQYYIYVTHHIFDLLTNFNYGINFYLYIISGKHIRNELIRAFRNSSCRSTVKKQHGKYQRSSYVSSYVNSPKHHHHQGHHSLVQLSRRPTGSSV